MDICVTSPSEVRAEVEMLTRSNTRTEKYGYPEFAGWQGERYLKKLLRQILPMALYRTWEICVDHQAPGNDCYVGIARLAEVAGRAMRTMEKNLAAFCARQLLVEQLERKVIRTVEGRLQCKVVVTKDFSGLYALAHDYHEWLGESEYLAPQRGIDALLAQEPHLLARLRRFENYRRVLFHHQPGPSPQPREEDRWFTDYQSTVSVRQNTQNRLEYGVQGEAHAIPTKQLAKDLSEDLSGASPKRIRESFQIDFQKERDVDDSAFSSSSSKSFLKEADRTTRWQREQHLLATRSSISPRQAYASSREEQTSTKQPIESLIPSVSEDAQLLQAEQEKESQQVCPGQLLAESFVRALAALFGDKNPQGTRTRVATLLRNANLEQPAEVLPCLIRAYVVARDTGTIRAKHCDPTTGQANRMPLFCAMVQRLSQGQQEAYRWPQMEVDITADAFLKQWWNAHQELIGPDPAIPAHTIDRSEENHSWFDIQEADGKPGGTLEVVRTSVRRHHRPNPRSKTEQEQAERASLAHRVLMRLLRMAVPIQGPVILWEHVMCGCPLYHTRAGREVCALCSPDPAWPEEALSLIRSITQPSADTGVVHESRERADSATSEESFYEGKGDDVILPENAAR